MDFDLDIRQCFLEEELSSVIDLKNLSHLKKMARVLVEERAVIKRVAKENLIMTSHDTTGNVSVDSISNLYTVEINLNNPVNF